MFRIERREFSNVYTSALKVLEVPHSQEDVVSARSQGMSKESMTSYFYGMVEDVVEEISLMSKLQGISNIVSYHDHAVVEKEGEFGWLIFIRMELLTKLNDILMSESLYKDDGIKIGIDICKALEVCERNKIIHRDIKPENVFRSDQGDYKLGDFGIARQMEKTVAGTKTGTYSYMAPEVYNRQPYNMTVDIYSLGILLYRLFNNGRFPFLPPYPATISYLDKEKADLKRLAGEEMPDPCNADPQISYVIKKACAYNPKDRYSTADELAQDLKKLLHDLTANYDPTGNNEKVLNPEAEVERSGESISTEESTVLLDTSTQPRQDDSVVNSEDYALPINVEGSTANDSSLFQEENNVSSKKKPRKYLLYFFAGILISLLFIIVGIRTDFFTILTNKKQSEAITDKEHTESKSTQEKQSNEDVGHSYELIDVGLTWYDARDICYKSGGHLAVITSDEEQKEISRLLVEGKKNNYWIGGYQRGDSFSWITGEEWNYDKWAPNQPDTDSIEQECVMIYRLDNPNTRSTEILGDWNDLAFSGEYEDETFFGLDNFGFICEWDRTLTDSELETALDIMLKDLEK